MSKSRLIEFNKFIDGDSYLLQSRAERLEEAMTIAKKEVEPWDRAVRLALSIQAGQFFHNANTRTGSWAMYEIITAGCLEEGKERILNARPYQVYGLLGYFGPKYSTDPENCFWRLAQWAESRVHHNPRPASFNRRVREQFKELEPLIETFKRTTANKNQIRTWIRHYGYGCQHTGLGEGSAKVA
jgi:hypothetical protein